MKVLHLLYNHHITVEPPQPIEYSQLHSSVVQQIHSCTIEPLCTIYYTDYYRNLLSAMQLPHLMYDYIKLLSLYRQCSTVNYIHLLYSKYMHVLCSHYVHLAHRLLWASIYSSPTIQPLHITVEPLQGIQCCQL